MSNLTGYGVFQELTVRADGIGQMPCTETVLKVRNAINDTFAEITQAALFAV